MNGWSVFPQYSSCLALSGLNGQSGSPGSHQSTEHVEHSSFRFSDVQQAPNGHFGCIPC